MKAMFAFLFTVMFFVASAQDGDVFTIAKKKEIDTTVYVFTEQQPEFPGGDAMLMKFIADSVRYAGKGTASGLERRVMVKFVIDSNGSVRAARVTSGVSPELDAEAIRVVGTLPKFIPARKAGMAVSVYYNLPVAFRIR